MHGGRCCFYCGGCNHFCRPLILPKSRFRRRVTRVTGLCHLGHRIVSPWSQDCVTRVTRQEKGRNTFAGRPSRHLSGVPLQLSADKTQKKEHGRCGAMLCMRGGWDYSLVSMTFQIPAAARAPTKGPTMKIQRLVRAVPPWKMAGAILRAGFTLVPV